MQLKLPKHQSDKEIKKFFNNKLNYVFKIHNKNIKNNIIKEKLSNLYYLYKYIIINNRTTILEFGSGWSSLIFIIALNELYKKNKDLVKKVRIHNPFQLYILEDNKKYLNITKKRILDYFKKNKLKNYCKIHYYYSKVSMAEYKKRIVTEYKILPSCNPDFIYLDGPDKFNVKGNINGFSTRHENLMPMVSDLLKIEYFLIPGTIILVDGRTSNVRFLKDHFKRKWIYKNDEKEDFHLFFLSEKSLGKINRDLLRFYAKK